MLQKKTQNRADHKTLDNVQHAPDRISVLGSPACVETPSPDRAQRPGADLHEHRSEELPLLRKQGPGPHVASWGADLDENHSEELLSRYQAKTVQWTVFGF